MSLYDPNNPDAPIPGANYASDTRNWPWHRPPDITDLDGAVEHIVERLTETDTGKRYMSLIKAGTEISTITDMAVTLAVGRGKFTPDYAILVAGPVARMLEIMAKSYGIEYDMGIEEIADYTTSVPLLKQKELDNPTTEPEESIVEQEIEDDSMGFMSPATNEEQTNMLGYGGEDEELNDE
jgi:hypothetical protein